MAATTSRDLGAALSRLISPPIPPSIATFPAAVIPPAVEGLDAVLAGATKFAQRTVPDTFVTSTTVDVYTPGTSAFSFTIDVDVAKQSPALDSDGNEVIKPEEQPYIRPPTQEVGQCGTVREDSYPFQCIGMALHCLFKFRIHCVVDGNSDGVNNVVPDQP